MSIEGLTRASVNSLLIMITTDSGDCPSVIKSASGVKLDQDGITFKDKSYWVDLLSKRQKLYLLASIIPWAILLVAFIAWWTRGIHHISPLGSLISSVIVFYEFTLAGYFYQFLRRMKTVNPILDIDCNWRIAMVITKAPSEPWDVAKKTLKAALNQDIIHDTWLADEDPALDTINWCKDHGVRISTRKGVSDYHRDSWPRRTKCKEGNLAFFYDNFGYDNYDLVAQIDIDHVPTKSYLRQMILPFLDPSVGYVAAPSICDQNSNTSWSARGRLYAEATLHGPLQAGFNHKWAPFCIGSHYAVRTRALKDIGGIGPELAEDHSTSLMMNSYGWKGVFQINAIAHGDGPATFDDCMTQEYQWSRSLMMILLQWTPRLLSSLRKRQMFQFLFAQLWYPLISMSMIISIISIYFCLFFDSPMVRINYLEYVLFMFLFSLVNTFPIYLIKVYGLLRPQNSRLLSWEEPLFKISRLPWMFIGVVSGVYYSLLNKKLVFRVTPKNNKSYSDITLQSLLPYIIISSLSSLFVILSSRVLYTQGYLFLALNISFSFFIVALIILYMHCKENNLNQWSFVRNSKIVVLVSSFVLLIVASVLKLPSSAKAIVSTEFFGYNSLISNSEKKSMVFSEDTSAASCSADPCFGSYNFNGTLVSANLPQDLSHDFVYWGQSHAKNIGEQVQRDIKNNRQTMLTLELWPWALLDHLSLSKSEFKNIEQARNKTLLSDIPNGYYDSALLASLNEIKKYPHHRILVRLMHEMEIVGQYPWSSPESSEFIHAYRYIVNLAKAHNVKNIQWVWSPAGNKNASQYWPGSKYVDHVGLSIYAAASWNPQEQKPHMRIPPFSSLISDKYWVSIYNKPIILAEVGVSGNEAERIQWLADGIPHLKSFHSIWAWLYFDAKQPNFMPTSIGFPDWGLTVKEAQKLKNLLKYSKS